MQDQEQDQEPQALPWWKDARRRNRAAVIIFGSLALAGILFPAFTKYLFAGDQRVMVVTMVPDAGQAAREGLKETCGSLPGISVIPDQGNPDPRIQGRFPVRFDIADTTLQQQAALLACFNQNRERFGVVGYLPENDGN